MKGCGLTEIVTAMTVLVEDAIARTVALGTDAPDFGFGFETVPYGIRYMVLPPEEIDAVTLANATQRTTAEGRVIGELNAVGIWGFEQDIGKVACETVAYHQHLHARLVWQEVMVIFIDAVCVSFECRRISLSLPDIEFGHISDGPSLQIDPHGTDIDDDKNACQAAAGHLIDR